MVVLLVVPVVVIDRRLCPLAAVARWGPGSHGLVSLMVPLCATVAPVPVPVPVSVSVALRPLSTLCIATLPDLAPPPLSPLSDAIPGLFV